MKLAVKYLMRIANVARGQVAQGLLFALVAVLYPTPYSNLPVCVKASVIVVSSVSACSIKTRIQMVATIVPLMKTASHTI